MLGIFGRWGVGRTYALDTSLKAERNTRVRRYAYVSTFGLRSGDALDTAIVQSTVSMNNEELEPTVASFFDHVSTIERVGRMVKMGGRKTIGGFQKSAVAIS